MDQHPIPRQITSFEFKLIGFMTLKQFIYLVIFFPVGFIAYKLFPIPLINILIGVSVGFLGLAFAFVPINDRPLDVWIKNMMRRLNSPTQYFFQKNNLPIAIFNSLYFAADPHLVMTHIQSRGMLSSYLSASSSNVKSTEKRRAVQNMMQGPQPKVKVSSAPIAQTAVSSTVFNASDQPQKPFFMGIVKNNKKNPLPGIMIYVKDINNNTVRLLKSNPHGVFATYNSLTPGEYSFEVKDPRSLHFFDTIKIRVEEINAKPFECYSKDIL